MLQCIPYFYHFQTIQYCYYIYLEVDLLHLLDYVFLAICPDILIYNSKPLDHMQGILMQFYLNFQVIDH